MALLFVFACRDEPRAADSSTTEAAAPAATAATSATMGTSPADPEAAGAQAPSLTTAESRYLIEAVGKGIGHIELAEAVASRSKTRAVDELAGNLIAAHNEVNADLTTIALRSSVTLPNDAAPELQQTGRHLASFAGRNLDAAYLAELLRRYPELIRLHEAAGTTATDMELKKIAVRAGSMFKANLREARSAYAQVTGNAPPPPEPEPGSPPPASAGDDGTEATDG